MTDYGNHRIQKFTSDGRFVSKWGTWGSENGELESPHGIAIDSSGFVYVADGWNNRIQVFTPEGQYITKFGGSGFDPGWLNFPTYLCVTANGRVFVSDIGNNRIQVYKKIDLADAVLALQILAKMSPSVSIYKHFDIDGNGKVGLAEVIYILRLITE